MRILFCHTNYPAQFRRLAPNFAKQGHEVWFLHKNVEWHATSSESIKRCTYRVSRTSSSEAGALHPYLGRFEDAILEGQAAAREAVRIKEAGFYPDVIISHAGFGNGLYLKDVFPKSRRIGFFEWYYTSDPGGDVHFLHALHGEDVPLDRAMRLRTWNAVTLLELAQCHELVTPTEFQRQQFPEPYRTRFSVIHEGIEAFHLQALRSQKPPRPSCLPVDPNVRIVTHVARGFELYRGFPQAMLALASLQQSMQDVHVLIAGADQICYGGPSHAPSGETWGDWAKNSSGLDPERTHWLGVIGTAEYEALLAHSEAHLYMSIPFVLSWSLLEAMAVGAPLVASNTEPVREVLSHGLNALLAPFEKPAELALALKDCLTDRASTQSRVRQAQAHSNKYDSSTGIARWTCLLEEE